MPTRRPRWRSDPVSTLPRPRPLLAGLWLLLAALSALWLAAPAAAEPQFPKLTGRVVDAAGMLDADTTAALTERLAALEQTTGTQLVVATVPDMDGYEIEDYGYQLGRAWGIGQKGTNNGAILLVAPNQRKVRIEVGYGLEGVLTDAVTSQIIRNSIVPAFKAKDMPGGIMAGTDALIQLLQLPPDQQAKAAASAASDSGTRRHRGLGLGAIIWLIIIAFWLFLAISRGRRGWSRGPVIIWGPGTGGSWGRGRDDDWPGFGGGFGGGGGGFGGFSGGGGSFGGGGSSGSW
jgi:uncharacterized protein